jgi:hypothetical protein
MRDVYVIDLRLDGPQGPWHRYANARTRSTSGLVLSADASLSMADICADITHWIGQNNHPNIGNLHLCGHGRDRGATTFLQLGSGTGLSVENASAFRVLRPYWRPNSRIFIHGCFSASETMPSPPNEWWTDMQVAYHGIVGGTPRPRRGTLPSGSAPTLGERIFQALATHAGVTVVASCDEQWSDRDFRIEGRHVVFSPTGFL